jgi:hypothetical protein
VRGRALAHCGWFPTYTVGEDYALGVELKQRGYRGAYIAERLAAGEAPLGTRDVLRQRSRWSKGHMQVGGVGQGACCLVCGLCARHLPLRSSAEGPTCCWARACVVMQQSLHHPQPVEPRFA